MGQKGFDLGFGEKEILPGMHVVETNKLDSPIGVGSAPYGLNTGEPRGPDGPHPEV